jgi:ATP-dependent 26S proteasome regulatory subunit
MQVNHAGEPPPDSMHWQDSALMRPGRLDRILYVSPPDYSARLEIFKVNFSKMSTAADVSVEKLAEMVSSFC